MPRSTLQELRDLVKLTEQSVELNLTGFAREAKVQAAAKAQGKSLKR